LKFWDSSALLSLLVDDPSSQRMRALLRSDPDMAVWWGARIECTSAVVRLRRDHHIELSEEDRILSFLGSLQEKWWEVQPSEEVLRGATRILRLHVLKAAEALQLAAALLWFGGEEGTVVTFDRCLGSAAKLEGLRIFPE
jgi:predicted nucleic acid-binding protein